MSASAIVTATQTILQAALNGQTPVPNVILGIPITLNDSTTVYLFHDGYHDVEKMPGGVVQRHHVIPIHLMLLSTADPEQAEASVMALSDLIANAFYTNRRLNATAGFE